MPDLTGRQLYENLAEGGRILVNISLCRSWPKRRYREKNSGARGGRWRRGFSFRNHFRVGDWCGQTKKHLSDRLHLEKMQSTHRGPGVIQRAVLRTMKRGPTLIATRCRKTWAQRSARDSSWARVVAGPRRRRNCALRRNALLRRMRQCQPRATRVKPRAIRVYT